ncbi:MKI67 FHA domain-interacting nucleolar phosphoprotein-like [Hetaerina americana]|uniref:MKI67 FHA domain-interacting nucleolar phosphoprotein-like n=1 Tax=Hetaerina americana TaxID=62018 RepID=UPI003A7F4D86
MSSGNISLKKEQQSSFDIAVKRLRKKVKDGDVGLLGEQTQNRGVVRLACIPHGFYEDEMRQYFKQFGVVTRLRVARSRKTGNSKGFAFVEFKVPEVAKVVAETMNNYLMFDKIMKARYIPPEEQNVNYFIGVSKTKVPRVKNRNNAIALYNRKLTKKEGQSFYRRITKNLNHQLKKIKELGIEYDFKPVDKSDSNKNKAVLTLDESDEEVTFKIPRNVEVIKREHTTISVDKKDDPSFKEEDNSDSLRDNLMLDKAITSKFMKGKPKGALSKLDKCGNGSQGSGSLRGIKKPRSLKASTKLKLNDKKKLRDAVQSGMVRVKSSSNFNSTWQVKESC